MVDPRVTRRDFVRACAASLGARALGLTLPGVLLGGCSASRPRSGAGPYVQGITPTGAVLGARTLGTERLVVLYGLAGSEKLDRRVEEAADATNHAVALDGLAADTAYEYRVEGPNGQLHGTGAFHTPRAPGTEFTFLAVGDSGGITDRLDKLSRETMELLQDLDGSKGDENQQWRVAASMRSTPCDFVVHTGDVVYPNGARNLLAPALLHPFGAVLARAPLFPVLGNHDAESENGAPLLEAFGTPRNGHAGDGRSYSFDWGDAHFTFLDVITSAFDASSAQLAWAEQDLRATTRPWRIVVFHEPAFSARHADSDGVKAALLPLLERTRVDLVLNGNDHHYCRFAPVAGVTHVTTGGGGKSLYELHQDPRVTYGESVFHHVAVTVRPDRLRIRAIDATGRTFDDTAILR